MQADWQGGTIDSAFDRAFENPVCTAQMLGVQRLRAPQVFLEARSPAGERLWDSSCACFLRGQHFFSFIFIQWLYGGGLCNGDRLL